MVADGDPERAIEYILANYDFVGVQEMYPLSFGILTAMIGSHVRRASENVNPEASTSVEINDDLVKSVREVNRLDAAIYAYFAGRLAAVQEVLSRDLASSVPTRSDGGRQLVFGGDCHGVPAVHLALR